MNHYKRGFRFLVRQFFLRSERQTLPNLVFRETSRSRPLSGRSINGNEDNLGRSRVYRGFQFKIKNPLPSKVKDFFCFNKRTVYQTFDKERKVHPIVRKIRTKA